MAVTSWKIFRLKIIYLDHQPQINIVMASRWDNLLRDKTEKDVQLIDTTERCNLHLRAFSSVKDTAKILTNICNMQTR
jgi:hypothetical protein